MPVMEFGDSDALPIGTEAIIAAAGGCHHAIETKIVGRQEFAGYWEYLIDNAIFAAPAHPFWSGSPMIDRAGKLVGTGSLILQQGEGKKRTDMNMIVPISLLRPVLDALLTPGRASPPRPWLGMYAMDSEGGLVVGGVSDTGRAALPGSQAGDCIVSVGDEKIPDLGALWRKVWAAGHPGAVVTLRITRDGEPQTIRIKSADRGSYLRGPKLH